MTAKSLIENGILMSSLRKILKGKLRKSGSYRLIAEKPKDLSKGIYKEDFEFMILAGQTACKLDLILLLEKYLTKTLHFFSAFVKKGFNKFFLGNILGFRLFETRLLFLPITEQKNKDEECREEKQ